MSVEKKITDYIQDNYLIDHTLNELIAEASVLFEVLNKSSEAIRKFEKSLSEIKAHFPFRFKVKEEKESSAKKLTDEHKDLAGGEFFTTQVIWYLAWDVVDESSKNYRLLLIAEEKEFIHSGWEETYNCYEFRSKLIFRKSFIETDLATRLMYVEHLDAFIGSFTIYLNKYRRSIIILAGGIPLEDDI